MRLRMRAIHRLTWIAVCLCLIQGHAQAGNRREMLQYQHLTRYYIVHKRILGPGTKVINANEEMWNVFRQYRVSNH